MQNVNSTIYDPRCNPNFKLDKKMEVKLYTHSANVSVYKSKSFQIFHVEWKSWDDVWGESFIGWHNNKTMPETEKEFTLFLDAFLLSYKTFRDRVPTYTENELKMIQTLREIVEDEREKAAENAIDRYIETNDD